MRRQEGFTLLEVMIAMCIFTLIGLGAHVMLSSILRAREVERDHAAALGQVQKALWVLGQDAAQMEGQTLSTTDTRYAAQFLRRGWTNPLGLPRSDLMHVAYQLQGGVLSRLYWPERDDGSARQVQVLMGGVTAFSVRTVSGRSVEITVETPAYGSLRRVVEVPDL